MLRTGESLKLCNIRLFNVLLRNTLKTRSNHYSSCAFELRLVVYNGPTPSALAGVLRTPNVTRTRGFATGSLEVILRDCERILGRE